MLFLRLIIPLLLLFSAKNVSLKQVYTEGSGFSLTHRTSPTDNPTLAFNIIDDDDDDDGFDKKLADFNDLDYLCRPDFYSTTDTPFFSFINTLNVSRFLHIHTSRHRFNNRRLPML